MPISDGQITDTITLLRRRLHTLRIPIRPWKISLDGARTFPPPLSRFRDVRVPAPWGGYDVTTWFAADVVIPRPLAGLPVEIHVDLHEGLLFVNGEPFHGLDPRHRDVLLCERARAGTCYRIAIQAYSGRERKRRVFRGAVLQSVDPAARALAVALTALRDAARHPRADGDAIRAMLDPVCSILKGAHLPGADTLERAARMLTTALDSVVHDARCATVHLVGHSHIDVVWLWTLEETRRKCARTFSTALRLMDELPSFRFTQSQALLYEYTKHHYPSLYRKIKQRVAEGRWEPTGSTWVEPDCNIPNGESLIRQIVYGKRFFQEEFGIEARVLWLPDTFGYSWALPQILAKAGIRYFCTTKLTWNDTTVFPLNTFWWKGVDGTRIFTHLPSVGLEGLTRPEDLAKSCDALQRREICRHTLQTYGYGDGGGGVTREQVLSVEPLGRCPGLPEARITSVEEFFREAETCGDNLPTWEDELYLEMHRGTYTTHGWVKRANRRAEYRLYSAELLCALARIAQHHSYPALQLEKAWKRLLLNQFHDIVPGTFIQEASAEARSDFAAIDTACDRAERKALPAFVRRTPVPSGVWTVFNPSGWTRSDYVELRVRGSAPSYEVRTAGGRPVDCQVIGRAHGGTLLLCYVEDVLPFAFAELHVSPGRRRPDVPAWDMTQDRVQTPLLDIRLDDEGKVWSVVERQTGHEAVRPGCAANELQTFIDRPAIWEAWEITRETLSRRVNLFRSGGVTVAERGPLRARLRVRLATRRGSRIVQDILAYHRTGRLDFRTFVRWRERQRLLKAAFPANVEADRAVYEIQLGALERSSRPASAAEGARFEVPAQQWADVSDGVRGAALMNDCKYGYDALGSTLRLTLIRSPHYPHPVTPMNRVDQRFTDQGDHEFTYAFLPHAGDWRAGRLVHLAREFNLGLRVFSGSVRGQKAVPLEWNSTGVLVDAVKWADDGRGLVVRAHEAYGLPDVARVALQGRMLQAEECDLLERAIRPLELTGGTAVELRFSPFEIKTIRLAIGRRSCRGQGAATEA